MPTVKKKQGRPDFRTATEKPRGSSKSKRRSDSSHETEIRLVVPDTEVGNIDLTRVTDKQAADISQSIQEVKRIRDRFLKSRITIANQLASSVATVIGYASGMSEKDRKAHWDWSEARVNAISKNCKRGAKGKPPLEIDFSSAHVEVTEDNIATCMTLVIGAWPSIVSFNKQEKLCVDRMEELAMQLPVWDWAEPIRGINALTIANIIGETGDLFNYANPAKVWKRMGCAPFEKDGETHVGSSWPIKKWRENGGLSKEDWIELGYCPRRRSVVYMLAKCLMMQNKGEYRARYDDAKKAAAEKHPDWTKGHCDKHALLLCGKRFLRNLWIEWNRIPE